MLRYIRAEQGLEHSVIYTRSDGKYFRYYGGTWPWRNNNPGNIHPGEIRERHGQIGVAGKMAVFPTCQNGHDALIELLKTQKYSKKSINQLVDIYAPPKDDNKNNRIYKKFLHDITGVIGNKKIKDFTDEEFTKLCDGIETFEGAKDKMGKIVEVCQVSRVHKGKDNFISEYYIENKGWITKDEALKLANLKQLDVEICISKNGNTYLRAREHSPIQNDFDSMIEKNHEK